MYAHSEVRGEYQYFPPSLAALLPGDKGLHQEIIGLGCLQLGSAIHLCFQMLALLPL